MTVQRKATPAKVRETEKKPPAKEPEARRGDRLARIQERAVITRRVEPVPVPVAVPVREPAYDDSPRAERELRFEDMSEDDGMVERRYRSPDEAAEAE